MLTLASVASATFAVSYYTMHRMLHYHARAVEVQIRVARLFY